MSRHPYMKSFIALAAFAALVPAASVRAGTVLLQDDFESYADTAAMNAVWNFNAGNISTLDTTLPGLIADSTTKSLQNLPTASNQQAARTINPTAIQPSASNPIYWTFDFYYDGQTGTTGKRMTAGLRKGASTDILEMGFYNSAYDPFLSTPDTNKYGSGFAVRTVNVPGSGGLPENTADTTGTNPGGWRLLSNADNTANFSANGKDNKWFTFGALIQDNTITFTLDYDRDGTIDSTYVATAASLNLTAAAFDTARLGTGLTSAGNGADFDNVLIRSLDSGDANHDGTVNADDYALIDRGAAKALTGWSNGDFNNDGLIDASDYLLIDTSYLALNPAAAPGLAAQREAQFGAAYSSSLLAAVPEPTSLLAAGGLALFSLRRRRQTR